MDRIPGFGPVDLGSNPSRLITNIFKAEFLSLFMEYNSEQVKNFLKFYDSLFLLSGATDMQIYIAYKLEDVKTFLEQMDKFPKEIYSGDERLEKVYNEAKSRLEKSLIVFEEELEGHKEESCREREAKRPRPHITGITHNQ